MTDILEGRVDAGITLDYMVRDKQNSGEPLSLVYPNDGFVVIPSPIAIAKSSRKIDAAKKFMDFVDSLAIFRNLSRNIFDICGKFL